KRGTRGKQKCRKADGRERRRCVGRRRRRRRRSRRFERDKLSSGSRASVRRLFRRRERR
ncbi:unnamed protein product, partial [Ixodes persulcatus]